MYAGTISKAYCSFKPLGNGFLRRLPASEGGTLTAVPRSTQPSTLRGMVKWVSAFGLSNNNKWRWWVWFLAAYTGGLTARVVWPGLRVGGRLAPCHIHHMNRVNSRSGFELRWQHRIYCRWYYYYYYIKNTPRASGICQVLEHIATKFQRLCLCFRCQTFWQWYFRFCGTSTCARNPRWRPNYRKYQ